MTRAIPAVAIVTGAGQGIGRAIARRLAREGYAVAAVEINAEALQAVRQELAEAGHEIMPIVTDLSELAAVRQMIDRVAAQWERIDALVNNAGWVLTKPFVETSEDDWEAMLSINLRTVFFATQIASRHMIDHAVRGRVVNIASIAGRSGRADQAPYAAAKAGVINVTRSAAKALAPYAITVNAVCPGVVDTGMTRGIHQARAQMLEITPEESLARMVARIPLGRLASPDDVAAAVAFFCSAGAAYITGQALNVCGGLEMD